MQKRSIDSGSMPVFPVFPAVGHAQLFESRALPSMKAGAAIDNGDRLVSKFEPRLYWFGLSPFHRWGRHRLAICGVDYSIEGLAIVSAR